MTERPSRSKRKDLLLLTSLVHLFRRRKPKHPAALRVKARYQAITFLPEDEQEQVLKALLDAMGRGDQTETERIVDRALARERGKR